MKKEVLGQCPICNNNLKITKLHCKHCNTTIEGDFALCKFCHLKSEEKDFALIFIKNRGNIKESERELGVSYPTVKGKLDSLIQSLGLTNVSNVQMDKKEILEKLDNGLISADEAIELMNE